MALFAGAGAIAGFGVTKLIDSNNEQKTQAQYNANVTALQNQATQQGWQYQQREQQMQGQMNAELANLSTEVQTANPPTVTYSAPAQPTVNIQALQMMQTEQAYVTAQQQAAQSAQIANLLPGYGTTGVAGTTLGQSGTFPVSGTGVATTGTVPVFGTGAVAMAPASTTGSSTNGGLTLSLGMTGNNATASGTRAIANVKPKTPTPLGNRGIASIRAQ